MKKILIVSRQQFGYLIDIYKWCKYLDDSYSIDVITLGSKPKVILNRSNFRVHYVSDSGNRMIRGIRFILVCLWHIMWFKGTIIVEFFKGCNIFKKVFPYKRMVLDVRTLNVSEDKIEREREDRILKQYTDIFDYTTIISEGTRKKLRLQTTKSAIIPLGADIISLTDKKFLELRLLYVGTLAGRKIEKTINGLCMYIKRNPNIKIHYDIVGDGNNGEKQKLQDLINVLNLNKYVTLHGYKLHDEIKDLYDICNVGVSFIPITDYYDYQPPTKTYEYILSGIYTIATGTFSNKEIITKDNGIIINDDEISFCAALEQINNNRNLFDSNLIRKSLLKYQWEVIVKEILQKVLKEIEN